VSGATYVVQPGDTLWSVAARLDRGGDLRDTVQALAAANGGSAITAGQRLVLP
jgi:LysM repeat protein